MNSFGNSLLYLCFSFLTITAFSQPFSSTMPAPKFPVDGFVILKSQEKIYGSFTSRKVNQMTYYITEITFSGSEGEVNYTPDDIIGFGIKYVLNEKSMTYTKVNEKNQKLINEDNWAFFESKKDLKKGKRQFMLRLKGGEFKIFHNPRTTLTLSSLNGKSYKYYGNYTLGLKNSNSLKLNKKNYEEYWPKIFEDSPETLALLNENKEMQNFKNFLLVINEYNSLINKSSVIYSDRFDENFVKKVGDTLIIQYLDSHLVSEVKYVSNKRLFDDIIYSPDTKEPYSGLVKLVPHHEVIFRSVSADKDPVYIGQIVNGLKNGKWTLHRPIYRRSSDPKKARTVYFVKYSFLPTGKHFYVNGKKHGEFSSFYVNGAKDYEKSFDMNKPINTSTWWYENGVKKNEIVYDSITKSTRYGLNGLPINSIEYIIDKDTYIRHGEYINYYETGEKKDIKNYSNGKEDGISRGFYINGNTQKKSIYLDGKLNKVTRYNEAGEIISEKTYE